MATLLSNKSLDDDEFSSRTSTWNPDNHYGPRSTPDEFLQDINLQPGQPLWTLLHALLEPFPRVEPSALRR
jgi:hypothetical protein